MTAKKRKKPIRKPKYYWMLVTDDELELPLYVADTVSELAEKVGISAPNVISSIMSRAKRDGRRCHYIKVPREQEE